ncbi:hypothetical protein GTO36_05865 [bacterium]|nr:hypothetical protein [bacterium]
MWKPHYLQTDDVDTQWKKVLIECKVDVTYVLSPQATGKIERLYQWMQDRVVRTCARERVSTIEEAQKVLEKEVARITTTKYTQLQGRSL